MNEPLSGSFTLLASFALAGDLFYVILETKRVGIIRGTWVLGFGGGGVGGDYCQIVLVRRGKWGWEGRRGWGGGVALELTCRERKEGGGGAETNREERERSRERERQTETETGREAERERETETERQR